MIPDGTDEKNSFNIDEYRNHKAWSEFICNQFGEAAAISFAIGSDIVLDHIEEDLYELSKMPRGSHVGQIPASMTKDMLPAQFLTRYDYEFLYHLKVTVEKLRGIARYADHFLAHNVMQEMAIYLY